MQLKDSFTVQASIENVWKFLIDLEQVGQCMPGVESLEAVDDTTFTGKLKVKVGPISAAFSGTAKLIELDEPHRLVADISGDDKASASAVKAAFSATLEEIEDGVRVNYDVDVTIRGRLGQFGLTVIRGTAKKMTAKFVECLQEKLSEEATEV